jgi:hypothetical protein
MNSNTLALTSTSDLRPVFTVTVLSLSFQFEFRILDSAFKNFESFRFF